MPTIEETRALLVKKLKQLFQLDQPELDFGFYRIMHLRNKEISDFLEKDLLSQVKDALTEYIPIEKQDVQKRLNKAIKQAERSGANPETLPKVKELREKLSESVDMKQIECDVYDALFHFFSRYYSDGDFISQRVYKEGVYAIPYEGEEVKLHWANADQYYVKTCEYLRDYCFRTESNRRIHFRLIDATEGEHGNIKTGKEKNRVFILVNENFCTEENGELTLRFEYRPATMTDWSKEQRSEKKTPPTQEDLIGFAVVKLESWAKQDRNMDVTSASSDQSSRRLEKELFQPYTKSDGEDANYSVLVHHLKRYAARNTFDYFIHKDLGTFLRRELDFFIKNEIMNLDDIEKETAPYVEQYLSKLRAVRRIAKKIITFLAQLEDFQKKLWLKKKFIVETNYGITLDRVPEEFYEEIAANNEQREEWKRLFNWPSTQSGLPTVHRCNTLPPNLVLDTKFFSEDFKQRLLDAIPNFDEQCDGLLIHSENFQALNLLQQRYKEQVKCVYIDPPYNTGNDGFIYKDSYQHSCWISMIKDRIAIQSKLTSRFGIMFVSVDDNENIQCRYILNNELGDNAFNTQIIVQSNKRGQTYQQIAKTHEYLLVYTLGLETQINELPREISHSSLMDSWGAYELWELRNRNPRFGKHNRPNLYFPFYVNPEVDSEGYARVSLVQDKQYTIAVFPKNSEGLESCWRWGKEKVNMALLSNDNSVLLGRQKNDGNWNIYQKARKELVKAKSIWFDTEVINEQGTIENGQLGISLFGFPKPVSLIFKVLQLGTEDTDTVLDYFAGSGTTGHAVINLNREDDGHRKYILVEMGDHFDTVLKPRIEKVIYSKDWKDGKPLGITEKQDWNADVSSASPGNRASRPVVSSSVNRASRPVVSSSVNRATRPVVSSSVNRASRPVVSSSVNRASRPVVSSSVSQCFKYIRLESYEDTLNNLEFKPNGKLQKELKFNEDPNLREEYILKYYLEMESNGCPSLLSVDAFFEPTGYRLQIKKPGSDELVYQTVDLLETFNYLIGLKVNRIAKPEYFTAKFKRDQDGKLHLDGKLKRAVNGKWWFRFVIGETLDGQKVLIIWRNRPGKDVVKEDSFEVSDKNAIYPGMEQDNIVLNAWFEKLGFDSTSNEFDIIYVNGTNNLDNLNTSDSKWKVRLIEDEFQTKMWE